MSMSLLDVIAKLKSNNLKELSKAEVEPHKRKQLFDLHRLQRSDFLAHHKRHFELMDKIEQDIAKLNLDNKGENSLEHVKFLSTHYIELLEQDDIIPVVKTPWGYESFSSKLKKYQLSFSKKQKKSHEILVNKFITILNSLRNRVLRNRVAVEKHFTAKAVQVILDDQIQRLSLDAKNSDSKSDQKQTKDENIEDIVELSNKRLSLIKELVRNLKNTKSSLSQGLKDNKDRTNILKKFHEFVKSYMSHMIRQCEMIMLACVFDNSDSSRQNFSLCKDNILYCIELYNSELEFSKLLSRANPEENIAVDMNQFKIKIKTIQDGFLQKLKDISLHEIERMSKYDSEKSNKTVAPQLKALESTNDYIAAHSSKSETLKDKIGSLKEKLNNSPTNNPETIQLNNECLCYIETIKSSSTDAHDYLSLQKVRQKMINMHKQYKLVMKQLHILYACKEKNISDQALLEKLEKGNMMNILMFIRLSRFLHQQRKESIKLGVMLFKKLNEIERGVSVHNKAQFKQKKFEIINRYKGLAGKAIALKLSLALDGAVDNDMDGSARLVNKEIIEIKKELLSIHVSSWSFIRWVNDFCRKITNWFNRKLNRLHKESQSTKHLHAEITELSDDEVSELLEPVSSGEYIDAKDQVIRLHTNNEYIVKTDELNQIFRSHFNRQLNTVQSDKKNTDVKSNAMRLKDEKTPALSALEGKSESKKEEGSWRLMRDTMHKWQTRKKPLTRKKLTFNQRMKEVFTYFNHLTRHEFGEHSIFSDDEYTYGRMYNDVLHASHALRDKSKKQPLNQSGMGTLNLNEFLGIKEEKKITPEVIKKRYHSRDEKYRNVIDRIKGKLLNELERNSDIETIIEYGRSKSSFRHQQEFKDLTPKKLFNDIEQNPRSESGKRLQKMQLQLNESFERFKSFMSEIYATGDLMTVLDDSYQMVFTKTQLNDTKQDRSAKKRKQGKLQLKQFYLGLKKVVTDIKKTVDPKRKVHHKMHKLISTINSSSLESKSRAGSLDKQVAFIFDKGKYMLSAANRGLICLFGSIASLRRAYQQVHRQALASDSSTPKDLAGEARNIGEMLEKILDYQEYIKSAIANIQTMMMDDVLNDVLQQMPELSRHLSTKCKVAGIGRFNADNILQVRAKKMQYEMTLMNSVNPLFSDCSYEFILNIKNPEQVKRYIKDDDSMKIEKDNLIITVNGNLGESIASTLFFRYKLVDTGQDSSNTRQMGFCL